MKNKKLMSNKKLNKKLAELKKLMEKYTEQQNKNIPADGRKIKGGWVDINSWINFYHTPFHLPKCCWNCSNNPMNNPYASGVCCCSLPDQEMIRW